MVSRIWTTHKGQFKKFVQEDVRTTVSIRKFSLCTQKGMAGAQNLGDFLRKRYVITHGLLSSEYIHQEVGSGWFIESLEPQWPVFAGIREKHRCRPHLAHSASESRPSFSFKSFSQPCSHTYYLTKN